MSILNKTKELCKKNNITPTRSKGQNFLINEAVYDDMIKFSEVEADDIILEVGPGLGFLTEKLAQKAQKVIAVELDDKLAAVLERRLKKKEISNVDIINQNVLDLRLDDYFQSNTRWKITANLPYNISSIFLRKFLAHDLKPQSITLMLQKEVAERISAKPPKMSLLAVSTQFFSSAELMSYVPAKDFWPMPEVNSSIIRLKPHKTPLEEKARDKTLEKKFFQLIKFGFSSKRKMLKNNLGAGYQIGAPKAGEMLKKSGFDEKVRAQELNLADWIKLFGVFEKFVL